MESPNPAYSSPICIPFFAVKLCYYALQIEGGLFSFLSTYFKMNWCLWGLRLLISLIIAFSVHCLDFSEPLDHFDEHKWFEMLGKTKSAWGKHSVFADWLVKEKETTDLIVDLGIDYGKFIDSLTAASVKYQLFLSMSIFFIGYSTFAFSRALTSKGTGGKVIGIDAFAFVVETADTASHLVRVRDTYDYVTKLKSLAKITNMEVIKGYFDEVAKKWSHGKTIDILHVDGRHEYENVKKDYNDFAGFVKEDGVIIFHDCYVWDQLDFGVHTFFKELDDHLYKGYFYNDYGLGVVTNNGDLFNAIRKRFPEFQLGYPTPPAHAHPSYFLPDEERLRQARQRETIQFLSDRDMERHSALGSESVVIDMSDVYTNNEINLMLVPGVGRVVEKSVSIKHNWKQFWDALGRDIVTPLITNKASFSNLLRIISPLTNATIIFSNPN